MPKQSAEFFANGKIILTSEYFVMHGAKALALPVKFGQSLTVKHFVQSPFLIWRSFYRSQIWFSAVFGIDDFSIQNTSNSQMAATLVQLFLAIRKLNPLFKIEPGTEVITLLEFDPQWGLGSSSTLVANLAQWANVDPFVLNEKVFGGSGFDIACSNASEPILYTKGKKPESVLLKYPFAEQLFFVYSGNKQGTRDAISKQKLMVSEREIVEISALTEQIKSCQKLNEFQELIKIHEQKVGDLIGQIPIQQKLFADFDGAIKSLGAWGGDFLLVASELDFDRVKKYFSVKGMTTIFRWEEMVRCRDS